MLVSHRSREQLDALFAGARCEIELPESYSAALDATESPMVTRDDRRRFPRQSRPAQAVLEYLDSFPWLIREAEPHIVYVRDLSRCGISFVHSAQLFPLEQVHLTFINGRTLTVEVARCRCISVLCFEIGVHVLPGASGVTANP
jgi:hypothetical protein